MTRKTDVREIIHAVPKTEIHLHLEGMASVESIWTLIQKHGLTIPGIKSERNVAKKFNVRSLDEFIDLFINTIQVCFREDDDVDLLLQDAHDYLKRNNIYYAEIFLAPTQLIKNGLSFPVIMKKLDNAMTRIKKADGIDVRFMVDVSRTSGVENAQKNLDLTLEHRPKSVIGIGLGGAESTGPARDYAEVFEKAKESKLRVVAHAGEDMGPESIRDALRFLKVERIGHGISAIQDPDLMDELKEKQIPLEICPTSNLFTRKYVTKMTKHPIRAFFDRGLKVAVNTDDPSIFGVDLVDEYMNLMAGGFFKLEEVLRLIKNGLFATFLPVRQRADHWLRVSKIIQDLGFDPEEI